MKQLDLPQIEVSMKDGSVRLVVFPVHDGVRHPTPHTIGLMAHDNVDAVLETVRLHLGGMGYEWIDKVVLDRALKHRDLILSDPAITAVNEAAAAERKRIADEEEAARIEEERQLKVAAEAAAAAEKKRIDDAVAVALAAHEVTGQIDRDAAMG